MNTLHVRGIPDDLYRQLRELARSRNRSLSAQVITLLARALEEEQRLQEQTTILDRIRRRRFTPPAHSPASLDLLREDRQR